MKSFSEYEPLLAMLELEKDIGPLEAERRAEKCFLAQSWLLRDLHEAEYAEIIFEDNVDMVKAELLLQAPEDLKNAPARDAWVFTRPKRREVQEKQINAKVNADRLRRMLRLFENAQNYYARKALR